MQNHLEKLNTEQRKAVVHMDGPLMVIAGAGSGKTRVLTHRIINLLENKISPFNILALTFTESAVYSMRKRLVEIIGSAGYKVGINTSAILNPSVVSTMVLKRVFASAESLKLVIKIQ